MKYCGNCGTPIANNDLFCATCGTNLSEARKLSAQRETVCGATITQTDEGASVAMKKGKNRLQTTAIIVAIVVISAIATYAVLSLNSSDDTAYVTTAAPATTATPVSDFYTENGCLVSYQGTETSIIIPDDVTSIGESAFSRCSTLKDIIIPDSVTSIGESAFFACSSLENIIIPDSVTTIGEGAFERCTSLTSVTIPASVEEIGEATFMECSNLTSLYILNPELEGVYYSTLIYNENLVVYGYSGSTAEAAFFDDCTFIVIDALPSTESSATASVSTSTAISMLAGTQWLGISASYGDEFQDMSKEGKIFYFGEDDLLTFSFDDTIGYYYDGDNNYSNGFKVFIEGDIMSAYINDNQMTLEFVSGSNTTIVRLEKR